MAAFFLLFAAAPFIVANVRLKTKTPELRMDLVVKQNNDKKRNCEINSFEPKRDLSSVRLFFLYFCCSAFTAGLASKMRNAKM